MLALLLVGCTPKPPAGQTFPSTAAGVLVIPVEVHGPTGWLELSMMVDTGAEVSTLTVRGRTTLALDAAQAPTQRLETANGIVEAPLVRMPPLRLAGAEHTTTTAVLCDTCPDDIDGMIGLNLLASYDMAVDADADTVTLTPRTQASPRRDIAPWLRTTARRQPLRGDPGVRVAVTNNSPWPIAALDLRLTCAIETPLLFASLRPGEHRALQLNTEPCDDLSVQVFEGQWN